MTASQGLYRATEFLQVNWGNALNLVGWVRPLDFGVGWVVE